MSPVYEVTATWTEQYSACLRIETASEEAALERAVEVWRLRPDWFVDIGKFGDSWPPVFRADESRTEVEPHLRADERIEDN